MKKLSFLIAGVQKGGTTALWHFLSQHPQIYLSLHKELHFFDFERFDWESPPYEILHAEFAEASSRALWGEATPIYTFWPPSLARIASYNPDIKLIVVLRNPTERAYSQWGMARARGYETLPFGLAIREGRARVDLCNLSRDLRRFSAVERGLYSGQVRRIMSLFPREQVLFLSNEDLRRRHFEVLNRTCSFLGVAPFSTPPAAEDVQPYRKSWHPPPMDDADRRYLDDLFSNDLAETEQLTGLSLGRTQSNA